MSRITRVVQMTFAPGRIAEFETLFKKVSPQIREVDGCDSLELLRDLRYPNIMVTISQWRDTEALRQYRESAFFTKTWARTKSLFAAPPVATSYVSADPDEIR